MNLGKSKSKIEMEPETGVTFKDVAGCEGSKQELMEIVEFLKNPAKYSALGAKIPRGAVMEGPPGTGGGGGGPMNPMNLGKSKSKIEMEPETGVTFKDVAGCEGSKQELMEIVEFLKNPAKYP